MKADAMSAAAETGRPAGRLDFEAHSAELTGGSVTPSVGFVTASLQGDVSISYRVLQRWVGQQQVGSVSASAACGRTRLR